MVSAAIADVLGLSLDAIWAEGSETGMEGAETARLVGGTCERFAS